MLEEHLKVSCHCYLAHMKQCLYVNMVYFNQTMISSTTSFSLQIQDVPLKTRRLVVRICDIVTRRAARLAAAGIVAILQKIGRDGTLCGTTFVRKIRGEPKKSVVAIEGGLYQGYSIFREYLNEAVDEILGDEIASTVSLRVMEEGSGIGAALLAASYSSTRQNYV